MGLLHFRTQGILRMSNELFEISSSLHVFSLISFTKKLSFGKKLLRFYGSVSQLFFQERSPKIFLAWRETSNHEKVYIPEILKNSERDSIPAMSYCLEYLFGKNASEMPVEVKLFSFGSGTFVFKVLKSWKIFPK